MKKQRRAGIKLKTAERERIREEENTPHNTQHHTDSQQQQQHRQTQDVSTRHHINMVNVNDDGSCS